MIASGTKMRCLVLWIGGSIAASLLLWGVSALQWFDMPVSAELGGRGFSEGLRGSSESGSSITSRPRRIASITLLSDEILAEIVHPDRIVAVTAFADNSNVSNIHGYYPLSIARLNGYAESIIRVDPDLVVVSAYTRAESVQLLMETGIPILRMGRVTSFQDILRNIEHLGKAVGAEERADQLIEKVKGGIAGVRDNVAGKPRPRVLYLSWDYYSAGEGTLVDRIIELSGGRNVLREVGLRGSARISLELAISLNPEILLTSIFPGRPDPTSDFAKDRRWHEVSAVKSEAIYQIDNALLLSTSHHAVRALEKIAVLLHPGGSDL